MEQMLLSPVPFEQLTRIIHDAVHSEFQTLAASLRPEPVQPKTAEYLTRQQTAERLGISLVTLNDWTKTGKVQGYRIGTRVRYKADEIDAALKAIRTTNSVRK